MTASRVTVSLPDDLRRYLAEKPNASAEVALALRQRISGETTAASLREILEATGMRLTEDGMARYRDAITDAQDARAGLTEQELAEDAAWAARWRADNPGLARLNTAPAA